MATASCDSDDSHGENNENDEEVACGSLRLLRLACNALVEIYGEYLPPCEWP